MLYRCRHSVGPAVLLLIMELLSGTSAQVLSVANAQVQQPEPGAVRLSNGMIFRGLCSSNSRFLGDDTADQRLELRMIDQGYRRIYVSTRRSEPTIVNPNDWPGMDFSIPQKRTGRKSIPDVIGVPEISPLAADGTATVTLRLSGGKTEEITVGITRINELYAEVTGLSHKWSYMISVRSIPPQRLFPGLLERVPRFGEDPFVRLELVRMLIRAGMLIQADQLLQSIAADFPDASAQLPPLNNDFRSELGRQILQDLELRRDAGQYQLALNAGRLFPRTELAPEVQLRTRQLVESIEDRTRRVEAVKARLLALVGGLQNPAMKQIAAEVIPVLADDIDVDSVERFSAFELLAAGDDFPPENLLALAISGWVLGAEEALQNLQEAYGLYDARQLVLDYLRTAADESELRAELLRRMTILEGVSVPRLASLIQHLPPVEPLIQPQPEMLNELQFQVAENGEAMAAVGRVPPEYRESRSYQLIVAFPREGVSAEATLDWWTPQASRHGAIVVVPEAWTQGTVSYDASADQHRRFLNLMRRLKMGLRIDDDRIFVAGHGIGAEAAADMATSHPELFAGLISIAGLGRKHLQWTAHNEPSMPWYVVVGERQGMWAERLTILLTKLFRRTSDTRVIADLMLIKYPERGFESFFEEAASLFEWMSKYRRPPFPEEINASVLRSTDLRWSWLELQTLPRNFALLDEPSRWSDGPFQPATIEARLTRNNAILIRRAPASPLFIKLAPGMPGIDLERSLSIVAGRERKSVHYAPSYANLLEELWQTGDRQRLCYMKIPLKSR